MTNYVMTIKKLQRAINNVSQSEKIIYATSQFYRDDVKHAITMYYVKVSLKDGEGRTNKTIFKNASQVRVLLFLKDMWNFVSAGNSIQDSVDACVELQSSYITAKQMERRR